jgi:hypothetical protein
MKFSKAILEAATRRALVSRGVYTRDGLQTYDQATIDAAGVFLIGELERLDPTINEPLVDYKWSRDIDLRTDVTIGDEQSSFTNSTFGSAPGIPGSNKSWVGKDVNSINGISLDIGKTTMQLPLWALQVGWTLPELASAQQLNRPIDMQKMDALQTKWQMDIDEQVYIGDTALGITGLLNHTGMTEVANAQTGTWSTASAQQILDDVNELLTTVWKNSGYAICPSKLLIPPTQYGLISEKLVAANGTTSILSYLEQNSISLRINGKKLDILPSKWCTGTVNSGQGPGAAGKDRMVTYTQDRKRIRMPLVPLQRTPVEYRSLAQLVTYYGRIGSVELIYPETIGARDNI